MPAKRLSNYQEIPPPDPAPREAGWGERLETMLVRFLVQALNTLAEGIQSVLAWGIENWLESLEASGVELAADEVRQILDLDGLPDEFRATFDKFFSGGGQAGVSSLLGFGAQIGMSAASAFLAPVMRTINYRMDYKLRTARADPSLALAIGWRRADRAEEAREGLKDLGWSGTLIDAIESVIRPRLGAAELLTLWRRGELSDEDLFAELGMQGWTAGEQERLKNATRLTPGVQDLIRMAVREAFTPEVIERFGLGAEFPEEFAEEAAKVGLSRDWALKFWYSHWELPSIRTGYEMLHRLRPGVSEHPFTAEDLDTLIKVNDITPFWRERLKEISFAPYTRVDVRRMYQFGILDAEQVYSAYLDLGYPPERAQNLADFAVMSASGKERDLTRAAVTKGYKRRLFSRDDAREQLIGLRYSEDEAEFWLSMADYELEQSALDEDLKRIKFLYVEQEISEPDVFAELGQHNLPASQIEELIRLWDIEQAKKTPLPEQTDLEDFYRRDIISLGQLRDYLNRKGWTEERQNWFIQRIDERVAEAAAKEAERAQKEQERVFEAERSSVYQQSKADLDVAIALDKSEIADIKLAKWSTPEEDHPALDERIDEIKADIANIQLAKAALRVDFLEV